MNLVFDNIVFSLQKSGGISVVWKELISRLVKNGNYDLSFLEYAHAIDNICRKDILIPSVSVKSIHSLPVSVERFHNPLVDKNVPFVFHSSYYRYCCNPNACNITTLHDFTYEYFLKGIGSKLHTWQKFRALRHSDYIVCISKNTKRDLLKFLPDIDESKVRVIYNGASGDYFETTENLSSINIPFEKNSYLVFVGSRVNYKNFELAVRSIAQTSYCLLIVGAKLSNSEQKLVNDCLPQERWHSAGFMSNHDLNIAYNNAAALVYPSKYEGFGIPVLEAQRAGCPVIAYNGSSIPEVIGETPFLMNNLTENELVEKCRLLKDEAIVKTVKQAGLEKTKRFSWDKMYQEYVELYNEATK